MPYQLFAVKADIEKRQQHKQGHKWPFMVLLLLLTLFNIRLDRKQSIRHLKS